jgi:hypothetical protein
MLRRRLQLGVILLTMRLRLRQNTLQRGPWRWRRSCRLALSLLCHLRRRQRRCRQLLLELVQLLHLLALLVRAVGLAEVPRLLSLRVAAVAADGLVVLLFLVQRLQLHWLLLAGVAAVAARDSEYYYY